MCTRPRSPSRRRWSPSGPRLPRRPPCRQRLVRTSALSTTRKRPSCSPPRVTGVGRIRRQSRSPCRTRGRTACPGSTGPVQDSQRPTRSVPSGFRFHAPSQRRPVASADAPGRDCSSGWSWPPCSRSRRSGSSARAGRHRRPLPEAPLMGPLGRRHRALPARRPRPALRVPDRGRTAAVLWRGVW
jgi:hypothetical protein